MIKRFGGNLAPLIGLCIAALVAATLASYVVVGQRYGTMPRTVVPDGGPLVLERPDTAEPLVLAGDPPPVAPVTPTITTVAQVPTAPSGTAAPTDGDGGDETFSGSLVTDVSPTLTERVFGVIDSVTFKAGTIKASDNKDKKEKKEKEKDKDKDKDDEDDEDAAPESNADSNEAVVGGSNEGEDTTADDETDEALPDDDGDDAESDPDDATDIESDSKDDKEKKDKKDKAPKDPKEPKEPKEPKDEKEKKEKKDKDDDD